MFLTWVPSNREKLNHEAGGGISTSRKEPEQEGLVKSRSREPNAPVILSSLPKLSDVSTHCAHLARSTRKHPPGTQSLLASLLLPNCFHTHRNKDKARLGVRNINPQQGHPITHHNWRSPIIQHGDTGTPQTALPTERSLPPPNGTYILATKSLPVQATRVSLHLQEMVAGSAH